ncbi:GDSL-like Lipase/Acylhydrolase [Planctomycetes bacterium Poly30]|uniref:GDSL-like Lipase/Acylhydrolase n=1 Tax=Saltatorellus ferox TaxID=2528018 RepID=A0A518ERU4_9BACT|nr:GDSL-like Lipase/Acylhydrolase [Planctomycetes bacterium Poly30]
MRKFLLRLSIFLGVLLALFVGTEVYFRFQGYGALPSVWFDPEVGTRFHPNQTRDIYAAGNVYMHPAKINSMGLRGHEARPEADGDAGLRIVCLGDSFTFGWGVVDDETFPVLVEKELDAALEKPVDVINCGLPGYNTYQEKQLYNKLMAPLKPDYVVVAWYLNDLDPMSYGTTGTLAPLDHPLAGTALLDYWSRNLRYKVIGLPKFEFKGFDQAAAMEMKKVYDAHQFQIWHDAGSEVARPFVERNLSDLTVLLDAIEAGGATPIMVVFPTVGQMDDLKKARAEMSPEEYAAARAIRTRALTDVAEHARARGVLTVELLDAYMDSEVRPYGDVDLTHPSATGQRIAADAVLAALKEAGAY